MRLVSAGAICCPVNTPAARPVRGEPDAQLPGRCHLLMEKQSFRWRHLPAAMTWPLCAPWGDAPRPLNWEVWA